MAQNAKLSIFMASYATSSEMIAIACLRCGTASGVGVGNCMQFTLFLSPVSIISPTMLFQDLTDFYTACFLLVISTIIFIFVNSMKLSPS
jgi:hypothetical protein